MFARLVVSEMTDMLYIQSELLLYTIMRVILITGFLICFHLPALALFQAQDSLLQAAEMARKNRQYTEAISLFNQSLEYEEQDQESLKVIYYGLGESHYRSRSYDKAIEFYSWVLDNSPEVMTEYDNRVLLSRARLGFIYRYRRVELKKALAQFKAEYNIIDQFDSLISNARQFINAYNLASTTRLLDDYNSALNYGFEALSIAQDQTGDNRENLSNAYSVIANILGNMQRLEEASQYYEKKIALNLALNGPRHRSVANDYNNISVNYLEIKDYDQAKNYLNKALDILETDEPDYLLLSNTYRLLGSAYRETGAFQLSRGYFEKSLNTAKGRFLSKESLVHENLAELFSKQHLFDSALLSYQKALGAVIKDFTWTSLKDNPTTEQLLTEPWHYSVLSAKAACWLEKYKYDGDLTALENAYQSFQLVYELTDVYRNNFTLESSKLFFQDWNYEHYVNAMETVYLRYKNKNTETLIDEAWLLIEKNKSLLMLENLLSAERVQNFNISDSLRKAQAKASQTIWNTQRDIKTCDLNQNCQESQLIKLRGILAKSEKELQACRESIRQEFPGYYRMTEDKEILSLERDKKSLDSHKLLVNYFSTDSAYYIVATDGIRKTFRQVKRTVQLDSMLTQFLTEVNGGTLAQGSLLQGYKKYAVSAYHLYEVLLSEILEEYSVKELIIIPDGLLALIPFDALISEMPENSHTDYANLRYLIHDYHIEFAYSATLWSNNRNSGKMSRNAPVLAFGTPELAHEKKLAKLTKTTEEVTSLLKLPNSRVLTGSEATEQNFKKESANASIIHLALHNINDRNNPLNSRLMFNDQTSQEDGGLYLYELFGLEMAPDLVVLSACETGVSEWQKGEGPYHIGRGFLHHGNPAMIVSLWKVSDATAAVMMKDFYEHFISGGSSVKALRNAKVEFLTRADELTAHPSNWAAFVGIGQISIKSGNTPYIYGLILLVLLGLTWTVIRLRA